MPIFRKVLVSCLLACTTFRAASATGQNSAPVDLRPIQQALDRMKQADAERARFIRLKLEHNLNFDGTGAKRSDTTKVFEDTWINDLPYSRLLEVNGKPLEGKALADEQARFDKAVAERQALDSVHRARLTGGHVYNSDLNLGLIATPAYQVTLLNESRCLGQPCHVYRADRLLDSYKDKAVAPFNYRLWITDANPLLTRLEYDVTADDSGLHKDSSGTLDYQLFDGVPVLQHSHFVGFLEMHGKRIRVDTENTYSAYRRFSTSVTVKPVDADGSPASVPQS